MGSPVESTPPRRPTYAVDLDGTLAVWDQVWRPAGVKNKPGEWLEGAQSAIARMLFDWCTVIVHTCRATWEAGGGTDAVDEFIRSGGFVPVHIVGQEMSGTHADDLQPQNGEVGVWVGVGKPIATYYIDDRGVNFDPELGWEPVLRFLAGRSPVEL